MSQENSVYSGEVDDGVISPEESRTFLEAFQRSWCLRDLMRMAALGNTEAENMVGQSLLGARFSGNPCFSEGCPMRAVDLRQMQTQTPELSQQFSSCKYPDDQVVVEGEVACTEIEP
jgi:hypothetical protein